MRETETETETETEHEWERGSKLSPDSFFFFNFFFNVYLFIGQRETEHEWGRGRERGRHRIGNRLQALSHQPSPEPDAGLELPDREIVTWLKSDA